MSKNRIYGAAIVLVKGNAIYLCRRTEKVMYPKKWQFVNGRLNEQETSMAAAVRIVKDQTNIDITQERLYFADSITIDEVNEFYFVYFVNLHANEFPENTCDRFRGDWRIFPLEKAAVLDVVSGIRPVIKKLYRSNVRFGVLKARIEDIVQKQQHQTVINEEERIRQQLSQGELLHLEKLGPKMTRLIGFNS